MRGKEMPFKLNFLKPIPSLAGRHKKRISTAILFTSLIFVLVTSYLLYIPQQEVITEHSLKVGDIVKKDIKIEKDITVEDIASTTAKRKEAIDDVVPVYEYYKENKANSGDLINQWFQLITDAKK
jgi:membrane-associated HD superfamily phosphohydrolase